MCIRDASERQPTPSIPAPAGARFLVMTHDHGLDYALCRKILDRNDFGWLGLIGSKSKGARFRSRLARDGVAAEAIARLVSPIGVEGVNNKWPAAIAVAVVRSALARPRSPAGAREAALAAGTRGPAAPFGARGHARADATSDPFAGPCTSPTAPLLGSEPIRRLMRRLFLEWLSLLGRWLHSSRGSPGLGRLSISSARQSPRPAR